MNLSRRRFLAGCAAAPLLADPLKMPLGFQTYPIREALGKDFHGTLKQIAATTACHAAVKAHYPLTLEKMHHILEELRATAYSTVCPHGRPVMLKITRREIEKNFDRI